jgi:hypothetical protein
MKQDEIEFMIKAMQQRNRMIEQELASNYGDNKLPWWVKMPLAWACLVLLWIMVTISIDIFNSICK